ncbi:MAG: malectin domain-containing carbohydrate-binding protein, partial [Pricia sp.]
GTYTATVTSTIEENVTVSGTLDGAAINNTGIITFNPDDSNPAQDTDQTEVGQEAGPSQIRINCGGEEVTFGDITFLADQYFSENTSAFINPLFDEDIANTEMDSIYRTERVTSDNSDNIRGPFSYNIPVENGTYTVRLYFAEIYWGVENPQGFEGDVGQRVFNVALEDTQIFTGYDLFADIGAGIADQRQYDVEVTDGELNIIFEASVNKPKISAIEIFGAAAIAAEEDGGEDEG